jgi:salicylate hydroxylase
MGPDKRACRNERQVYRLGFLVSDARPLSLLYAKAASLTKLLDMVITTQKWPIQSVHIPDTWASKSGRLVLLGDAAHAMLPNMALGLIYNPFLWHPTKIKRLGAAVAVEDAATLAECLKRLPRKEMLRYAIDVYEGVRIPRARRAQEASIRHGYTLHFPDGPLQQARDAAMRPEVDGRHFIASPNQWSDPTTQIWAYSYDPILEVQKKWRLPTTEAQ